MTSLLARGDSQVRVTRFAWSIDHAAHHRDLDRQIEFGQRGLGLVGDLDDVHLGAATTRTGNEVETLALAQTQRLEELATGAGFLDRVGRQRIAQRVADAFGEQRRDTGCSLQESPRQRTRLGHPEVQRVLEGR